MYMSIYRSTQNTGFTFCRYKFHIKAISASVFERYVTRNAKLNAIMSSDNSDDTVFEGLVDRFNGITVDSTKEPCNTGAFAKKLQESLEAWEISSKRGIWFKVALPQADWVPILAQNGFNFHHCKDNFVMMYKWIPKTETCVIPEYAHTMLGVGAVVINDEDQILVVSEKYIHIPHFKLPGGYVEPGEDIVDAAIREVLEETNVKTEFESVLTLRHTHNTMYECSDIYIVVSLRPLSKDILKCDREITHCMWMDVNEYINHPHVSELNRFFVQKFLMYKKHDIKVQYTQGIVGITKRLCTIYYVLQQEKK